MKIKIGSKTAFAHIEVDLEENETIRAESGAMIAMTDNIRLESNMKGGLLKGITRKFLAGETLFFQTLTSTKGKATAFFAPKYPGEIQILELNGTETYILQKNAFLAAGVDIDINTKAQNLAQGLFSGEGFFVLEASGKGSLAISSYGAIIKKTLLPNEIFVIDNGHLVAWSNQVSYKIEKASSKGWISSLTSGEGLVCKFTGPGDIYIQTRNVSGLAAWLAPFLPRKYRK